MNAMELAEDFEQQGKAADSYWAAKAYEHAARLVRHYLADPITPPLSSADAQAMYDAAYARGRADLLAAHPMPVENPVIAEILADAENMTIVHLPDFLLQARDWFSAPSDLTRARLIKIAALALAGGEAIDREEKDDA